MQKLRKLRGEDDFDSFSNRFLDNFLCLGLKQAPGKTTCCFYMLLCTMYCVQVTASRKLNKHDQRTTVNSRSEVKVVSVMTWSLCNSYFLAWIWQSPPFLDANLWEISAFGTPLRGWIDSVATYSFRTTWPALIPIARWSALRRDEQTNQNQKPLMLCILFEFTVFLYFFSAFCIFCKLFIHGTCWWTEPNFVVSFAALRHENVDIAMNCVITCHKVIDPFFCFVQLD